MATIEHEMELEQDFFDDTWSSVCSCGWSSKERNAEVDAIDDWENHCDEQFMEATLNRLERDHG